VSFRITILLKNKVPKTGVLVAATEEARLRDSEKFRKYAADCIRIANQMNGKDRQALLEIADALEARAQDSEKREKGTAPKKHPAASNGSRDCLRPCLTSMLVHEV
jgi:hypothetical protein